MEDYIPFRQVYITTQSWLLASQKPFENIVGKGENAGNQHFLLFPQSFLPFPKQISFLQLHVFLVHDFHQNLYVK